MQQLGDKVLPGAGPRYLANALLMIGSGIFYLGTAQLLLIAEPSDSATLANRLRTGGWLEAAIMVTGIASVELGHKVLNSPQAHYIVIAHKGHSQASDPGNTVANLKRAHASQPDYVEIDTQRTQDGTFVLAHSEKVKATNGKEYEISRTTWSTLKKIKIKTGGRVLPLTTLGTYLKRANQLKQRVLIELKIASTMSNAQLDDFVQRYGDLIYRNKAQLQSLNQHALVHLGRDIKVTTGVLSPVTNTVDRSKNIEFYAVEYSSLDTELSQLAQRYNKKVYVWTVNHDVEVTTSYVLGATGFITDYPQKVRRYLRRLVQHPRYHEALLGLLVWQRSQQ